MRNLALSLVAVPIRHFIIQPNMQIKQDTTRISWLCPTKEGKSLFSNGPVIGSLVLVLRSKSSAAVLLCVVKWNYLKWKHHSAGRQPY